MPRVTRPRAPTRRHSRRRWRLLGATGWRRVALATLVVVPLGAGALLWREGWPERARDLVEDSRAALLRWTGSAGLAVAEILVEGRRDTRAEEVLAVLDTRRGAPILTFSPAAAKAELERLPWVKSAAVERRLPDTIYVRLVEREALALWQRHGRYAVIDREGREIRGAEISRYAQLPIVVGEDAPRHAPALLALLGGEPEIEKRITHAIRVAGRRWNLRLNNGIEIQLPETDLGLAWAKLAEMERASRVLDRAVVAIDLRLPDRLVVRTVPDATPPPATPGARGRAPNRPT